MCKNCNIWKDDDDGSINLRLCDLLGVVQHLHEVLLVLPRLPGRPVPRPAPEPVPHLEVLRLGRVLLHLPLLALAPLLLHLSLASVMKVIVLVTAAVTWPVSWFQYWDLFSLLCHGCTVCWAACLVMSVLHMPRVIRALSSSPVCSTWWAWRPSCSRCWSPSSGCRWAALWSGEPALARPGSQWH